MTKLIWHIDRAKFQFQYEAEYQSWLPDPQVFFELGSSSADDVGAKIFVGPFDIKIYEHVSNLNAFQYSEFTAYLGIQYLLQDGFSLYSYIIFAYAGVGSFDESERVTKELLCRHFAGLVRDYHTAMNQLPPLTELVKSNEGLVESCLRKYRAVKKTWLDVINVQREMIQVFLANRLLRCTIC